MRSLKTEVDECIELVNSWEERIKRMEENYSWIKKEIIDIKKRF